MDFAPIATRDPDISWRRRPLKVFSAVDLARREEVLQEVVESAADKTRKGQVEPAPEEPTKRHGVSRAEIMSKQEFKDGPFWSSSTLLAEQCGLHWLGPRG